MDKEKEEAPNKQETEKTPECPSCGRPTRKASFRTGSVDHQPEATNVCGKCGTRT